MPGSKPLILPQELIDAVVDAIVSPLDLSEDPWIVTSILPLKACALVARTFVRPCQRYIFYGIRLRDNASRFASLLESSPHIASYIRAVYVETALERDEPVSIRQVLQLSTNLVWLDINLQTWLSGLATVPVSGRQAFAVMLQDGLAQASLQRVMLRNFALESRQLENLLFRSKGLKTLELRSPAFALPTTGTPTERIQPAVVLERLVLYFVKSETVQKLLETFKRVDLTKLRSLCLHNTPMNSLLAANASTLETLELRGLFPGTFLENDEPVDVFTGAAQLRVLDLQVPLLVDLIPVVRNFGSLRHLVKLHTVVIAVIQKAAPAEWTALDLLLGRDLQTLKEVRIRPGSDLHLNPHPHELVRSWMPILAEKGVLRITVDSS
ncbi:hypothetical protein C8F01DRAFT_1372230 [Mycena amicta]|nr:hypothetical protein C8F01DRAFT_1372230 [Mycena amicta]